MTTRTEKETPVLTVLHELKERVKRRATFRFEGDSLTVVSDNLALSLTMREVLGMIEALEAEERGRT